MKNSVHITLTTPLALAASKDAALPSKFSGTAYSGGKVPILNLVVDLATTQFSKTMPLLAEHNRDEVIGVIENTVNNGINLIVSGKLFSDISGSCGEKIAQRSQRGAPYQMSIGMFGYDEFWLESGQSLTINGQVVTGPVNVLKNGKVREVSIVALGADPDTDAQFFSASGAEMASNRMLSATELDAEAKTYMTVHPGTDYIAAIKSIHGAGPLPTAPPAVAMASPSGMASRAELDAGARVYMLKHPGMDYVSALKKINGTGPLPTH